MSMGWSSAEDEVRAELDPGERFLWAGQPRQGWRFQVFDFFFVPFSLIWGGFAIAWEVAAFAMDAPIFFKLWGIPFVLVGLYMMVGRFYFDARRRACTYYGLTDRSLLWITASGRRTVRRHALTDLGPVSLEERSDGSGVLSFGPLAMSGPISNAMFRQTAMMAGSRLQGALPFIDVQSDVREVYRRVRDAIEDAASAQQAR
jgi:hypothetical protein